MTENGIGTTDDEQRIRYTTDALEGVGRCLADGLDVRGYFHWSLMDNFEWAQGYVPQFGLVAVDRETQRRTPKPSAAWLGCGPGESVGVASHGRARSARHGASPVSIGVAAPTPQRRPCACGTEALHDPDLPITVVMAVASRR